jgi:formamidopyrimidine-DNA glycosylase
MPELPEVQTTASLLNKLIINLVIKDVWTDYRSSFHNSNDNIKNEKYFPFFKKSVLNKKITGVTRRAKNVLINLSEDTGILVHMKMTGHLLYGEYESKKKSNKTVWTPKKAGPLNDPYNRFVHLVFTLSNGKHLVLSDMRKFAKVCLIKPSAVHTHPDLKNLGPEPLDDTFSFKQFKMLLNKKPNGKIKQILMDQTVIAGIGNIYSDEALWLSSIHPLCPVRSLADTKLNKLYKNTLLVLRKGIDLGGDSMSDYRTPDGTPGKYQLHHEAYGRKGKACRKRQCGGIIERIKVGGRSAHFCPVHQALAIK